MPDDSSELQDAARVEDVSGGPDSRGVHSVFISYREGGDLKLAEALKRLIEGSLDPVQRAFVSGAGGLVPSNRDYRGQLTTAVRQASVFIGILTKESKDRDWINFEAGAAWGRDALYVPVAVDITHGEMPTTINGFQAVRANDAAAMKLLLNQIGQRTGAEVRSYFGNRFTAFERVVAAYPGDPVSTDTTYDAMVDLLLADKYDDAERMAESLLTSTTDHRERARIKVVRIACDLRLKSRDRIAKLEEIEPELKVVSPEYYYWRAESESRFHVKHDLYERCLALTPHAFIRRECVTALANARARRGDLPGALQRIRVLVTSSDPDDRSAAAWTQAQLDKKASNASRFTLLCLAMGGAPEEQHYRAICDLASEAGWEALSCYLSHRWETGTQSGTASNSVGIAATRIECNNVAVEAYERAAARGVSVAKVNIASLHQSHFIITTALSMLRAHEGPFDAASAPYPYSTRAALEDVLSAERENFDRAVETGRHQFELWSEFAELVVALDPQPAVGTFRFTVGADSYTLVLKSGRSEVRSEMKTAQILCDSLLPALLHAAIARDIFLFCVSEGTKTGVVVRLDEATALPITLVEVTDVEPSLVD